jgi:hypothetical protein
MMMRAGAMKNEKLKCPRFPCGSENAGGAGRFVIPSRWQADWGLQLRKDHGRFHFADYIGDMPYVHV